MEELLYNSFSHLGELKNVSYFITEKQVQHLEIIETQGYFVHITIPNGVFEWFVDIFDERKNKIHSDWTEHYGSPQEILKVEMKIDIERFVNDILKGTLTFKGDSIINEFYKNK